MPSQTELFIWNKDLETLPRQELEALQLQRLKAVIDRAAERVPFYKTLLSCAQISGQTISTISDIKKLPLTTKSDLRDNYPFGLLAIDKKDVARIHASSGTRGKPTVAMYSAADIETWAELCARSLAAAGVRAGDIVQNSYGYGLFTGGLGLHYGAEKLGATILPASSGRTQQQIMLLQDLGARVLCCTPSYALNIAATLAELDTPKESLPLAIGIFGAEPWTESCRQQIQDRLGIRAYDIYGISELLGPGIAMECTEQNGLHIWEDHFLVEILNPLTGEAVADGEVGELVLTTLTKNAVPLLRYRTGDACSLLTELCGCGRTMRRISRLRGRLDDMLIIRGVNVYPSEIENVIFARSELSPHYQIVITREKALDSLSIKVEIEPSVQTQWKTNRSEELNRRNAEQTVSDLLRQRLGLTASVQITEPNTLPRSEGKAMRVMDLRSQAE